MKKTDLEIFFKQNGGNLKKMECCILKETFAEYGRRLENVESQVDQVIIKLKEIAKLYM